MIILLNHVRNLSHRIDGWPGWFLFARALRCSTIGLDRLDWSIGFVCSVRKAISNAHTWRHDQRSKNFCVFFPFSIPFCWPHSISGGVSAPACVCVCVYVCMLHRESTFHLTDDDNNINKSFAVFSALCDHLVGWLGLRPFIYFISIIGRSLRLRRPVGLPVHCLLYCLPIRNPRKRREYLINI